MKKMKKIDKKKIYILLGLMILAALLIVIFAIKKAPPEKEKYGNEEMIEIHNIEIEDFDIYGMGIMHDDKYYTLQYGVHLGDTSLIGEHLGKGTGEASLTSIEGNIYRYEENYTYAIDDGASFFKYEGPEDVILVQTIGDSTVNDMWVLSPDIMPKTSLYDLIENKDVKIKYYPDQDSLEYVYDIENQAEFLQTVKKVEKPTASQVAVGYMTFDDGSGLLYGADVYLDLEDGTAYFSPPSYGKLTFKASDALYKYYQDSEVQKYNKIHSMNELDIS